MKRLFLFMSMVAGVMLASCSRADIAPEEDDGGEQKIVVRVSNTASTKAGRQLLSEEPGQNIDNVAVWIVSGGKVASYHLIENWCGNKTGDVGGSPYDSPGHGREAVLTLKGEDKLTAGTAYTIYALGYSNPESPATSNYSDISSWNSTTKGANFVENKALSLKSGEKVEEIFAGSRSFTATASFAESVVLNRQVAGIFTYLEAIPFVTGMDDTKKITLELEAGNDQNRSLVVGSLNSVDLANNGNNTSDAKYVVNGTAAASGAKTIYTIDVYDPDNKTGVNGSWYKKVEKGSITIGGVSYDVLKYDNWNEDKNVSGTVKYKDGSVFGGEFVIPFLRTDNPTLKLVLKVGGSAVSGYEWAINLATGDTQLNKNVTYWNAAATPAAWATFGTAETSTNYSIVRNHLYGVGKRAVSNPDTPGTDPDLPEPLVKQNLTLRVNDNWEIIHHMTLD